MKLALLLPLVLLQGPALPEHPDDLARRPLQPFAAPRPVRLELPRGATLLVIPDEELPLVDGSLVFRGGRGAQLEAPPGLLELMADVLREGGSERTRGWELDRWLDSHAAKLDLRVEEDALHVDFSCVASDLGEVLEAVGELLVIPAYPESELEKSRRRLLTRILRRDEDAGRLADHLLDRVGFGAASWIARRPAPEAVAGFEREDLLALHRQVFGADRLIAAATGAVEPQRLAALLDPLLRRLPRLEALEPAPPRVFRQPARTRIHLYDRPGLAQTEVRLAAPGPRRLQRDYAPLLLWSYAVGAGGTSNRLMVRLRTELGLIYQGELYFEAGWSRGGRLYGSCSTGAASAGEVVRQLVGLLKQARAPLPQDELEAVRRRLENTLVFEIDQPEEVLRRAVDVELHGYPDDFWEEREERLRETNPEEVAAAVDRHLDADRLLIVVVGPAEQLVPQLEPLGEVVLIEPF